MTDDLERFDAVVVGAGLAGLKAAADLARADLKTALVDSGYLGGLVMNVGLIEGAAEFDGQSGADLVDRFMTDALGSGADYRIGEAGELVRDGDLWRLPDIGIAAPNVVLATGASLKKLGVPGEDALTGRGVSQCAYCDGGLYRGKPVVVVGGGDAAVQEALHLAELCGAVTMLVRGDGLKARKSFRERAEAFDNLTVRTNVDVLEVVGEDGVDAIRIHDRASGANETMPTEAVFVFVGVAPETALAPADAKRDSAGALRVDGGMRTNLPGLYAVGAARAGHAGGLTDALGDAVAAARAITAG